MTEAMVLPHQQNGQLRLTLSGEVDIANADDVERQIYRAIGNEATKVVIDLTEVTFIDSAGIKVLALLAGRLEQVNTEMHLVVPSGSLARRVVELTGLMDFALD